MVNCERTISKLSELSLGLIWVILYGVRVFALKQRKSNEKKKRINIDF